MKRVMLLISVVALLLTGMVVVADMESEHPQDQPLMVPIDMGQAPWGWYNEKNEEVGYTVDLANEIARRLGRPGAEIIPTNWSGIFAGLFAKKYEMIIGGVSITFARAESMDLTEPIMTLADGACIRLEDKDVITSHETFAGLRVGCNAGATGDTWGTMYADEFGFEILRFDTSADAIQALKSRQIDVVVTAVPPIMKYVAADPDVLYRTDIKIDLPMAWASASGQNTAACFRKGDPYRYEVERVLEGMKLDGTLAAIMEPYLRYPTWPNDCFVVYAGYGTPGIRGYEPLEYHGPLLVGE